MNKRGVFWIIAIACFIVVAVAFIDSYLVCNSKQIMLLRLPQTVVENVEHVATRGVINEAAK